MSANNTVKFKLDSSNPPPLTAQQRKRLKALASMPDEAIDYRDIPRQTGAVQWTRPGLPVASENKQQIALRVDADVLSFFKGAGNSKEPASVIRAASMRRCGNTLTRIGRRFENQTGTMRHHDRKGWPLS